MIRRRALIAMLGGAAVAWPVLGRAQQSAMPLLGILNAFGPDSLGPRPRLALRQGLGEGGFEEGRNLAIGYRFADGHYDRLSALAADLVAHKVSVIIASGGPLPARTAKEATSTIPIVFTIGEDPIAAGLVSSLARPGGNITGASFFAGTLAPKQIELAHDLLPNATTIAFIVNPDNPMAASDQAASERAAQALGLSLKIVYARSKDDLDRAVASAADAHAQALVAGNDAVFGTDIGYLIALAAKRSIPEIGNLRLSPETGALASYGGSLEEAYHQVGVYAARILKGEKPGDLPVTLATKYELVINLKTAKKLGLTISHEMLLRADDVIE